MVEIIDMDWKEVKRPNPQFFKILVGDFKHRMKFPANFVEHLQEDMRSIASSSSGPPSVTASIEGPTGRTWYAKLEKSTDGMSFTTGWSKFVEAHSLEEHELLIFRYTGHMCFTVLIFDKTACEKKDLGGVSGSEGRKARLRPRKLAFGDGKLGDQLKAEEKSVSGTGPMVIETEEEEEEEEESNAVETSRRKRKKEMKGKGDHKPLSRRRPVTEKMKLKAQQAAHSFASKNPFFVVRLKASHVYSGSMRLRFPVKFSRKYLPRTKIKVVLRVPANTNTWSVNYITNVAERDRLSRGWPSFVRDNFLEEGDYCAFELVKSAEFLVHIFRVSEEPLPQSSRPQ